VLLKKCTGSRQTNSRNIYNCFIFGASGVGKTSLLRSLIHCEDKPSMPHYAVNTVTIKDKVKYLALHEVNAKAESNVINSTEMEKCDAICLLYDVSTPGSLNHIVSLQKQLSVYYYIPIIYIANKTDLKPVVQVNSLGVEINQQTLEPTHISLKNGTQTTDIFAHIINVTESPIKRNFLNNRSKLATTNGSFVWRLSLLGGGFLLLGFVTYKIIAKQRSLLKLF